MKKTLPHHSIINLFKSCLSFVFICIFFLLTPHAKLSATGLLTGDRADYIIIMPEDWDGMIDYYISVKQNQGLIPRVFYIHDIYDHSYGDTHQEKIRFFIQEAWQAWQIEYVLLIGDINHIPSGLLLPDNIQYDMYYSLLNDDLIPDICVGRLPASNDMEVEIVAAKWAMYSSHGWGRSVLSIMGEGEMTEGFDLDFDFSIPNVEFQLYHGSDIFVTYMPELIINELNAGYAFVNYVGNSDSMNWHIELEESPGDQSFSFTSTDAASMSNWERLSFVSAMVSDQTAKYGTLRSISEEFILAGQGGAIGYIGSTVSLNNNELAIGLQQQFYEHAFHQFINTGFVFPAKAFLHTVSGSEAVYMYNYLGDPTLLMDLRPHETDNTPPEVSQIQLSHNHISPGSSTVLSALVTDNDVVGPVVLFINKPGYGVFQKPMVFNPETGFYEVELSNDETNALGTYHLQIVAKDVSQNAEDPYGPDLVVMSDNSPPVLDMIGNKEVNEGELLTFSIKAYDADNDELTYRVVNLPDGAEFNAGTQSFSWTPGFDAAGPYEVTFYVSDGHVAVHEEITITVSHVNRPPVIEPIENKTVYEGSELKFHIYASDPDQDPLYYFISGLPQGAEYNYEYNKFIWTPAYNQAGEYEVMFVVTDGHTEVYTNAHILVKNKNRKPELYQIGNKEVAVGHALRIQLYAEDPDDDDLLFLIYEKPDGAEFDQQTGVFEWTPTLQQVGVHEVKFKVTDGELYEYEWIAINVYNTNHPPVFDMGHLFETDEGSELHFVATAYDQDGDDLSYSVENLPDGAEFNSGSGAFSWTPDFTQAGEYEVLFTVTDGQQTTEKEVHIKVHNINRAPWIDCWSYFEVKEGLTLEFDFAAGDEDNDPLQIFGYELPDGARLYVENRYFTWQPSYQQAGEYQMLIKAYDGIEWTIHTIHISVKDVNTPPVLDKIGTHIVPEGDILEFSVFGFDNENDALTYRAEHLPEGAIFYSHNQNFYWQPGYNQSGIYAIVFSVSDGKSTDEEEVLIQVENVNREPWIEAESHYEVDEGAMLQFGFAVGDADDDDLVVTITNLPKGAVFYLEDRFFEWQPTYAQAGMYELEIQVSDGTEQVIQPIEINVNNINTPPVFDVVANHLIKEGEAFDVTIFATDQEGDALEYSVQNLPDGAEFLPENHYLFWVPSYNQAGNYVVTCTVSDGAFTIHQDVEITVINVNRLPWIESENQFEINEGKLLEFDFAVGDEDNDPLEIVAHNLPQGAHFYAEKRFFSWQPTFEQAGDYSFLIKVSDGHELVQHEIFIRVNNVNTPPVLDMIGDKEVLENQVLEFVVYASDKEGDELTYRIANLPDGAEFNEENHTFHWKPTYEQAGTYTLTVSVSDGEFTTHEEIAIEVIHVNRQPWIETQTQFSVNEGETLEFGFSVGDEDGEELEVVMLHLPDGSIFYPEDRYFKWTPAFAQSGEYEMLLKVSDGHDVVQESIFIEVIDINTPPFLDMIGNKEVSEGELLEFAVFAQDNENDELSFSVDNLPQGAEFDHQKNTFSWTPGYDQAGVYRLVFEVSDGLQSDEEEIQVNVLDANRLPVIHVESQFEVNEGQELVFDLWAEDPDGDNIALSVNNLPEGSIFNPEQAVFSWTPDVDQAGTYEVVFKAFDGQAYCEKSVTIIVHEPVATSIVQDNKNMQICTYPNPAVNTFFIKNIDMNNSFVQIKIIDMNGRLAYINKQQAKGGMLQISNHGLSKGMYIIKLIMYDRSFTTKLIIKE